MKTLILAGGKGTRIQEETQLKPKPMIEIGGRPILWHIMKTYSVYGFKDFTILLGYKGGVIKDYFMNYFYRDCDLEINLKKRRVKCDSRTLEDWRVSLIDTGVETQTGGRIKRAAKEIGKERFLLTYGDGVANIDIKKLVAFHKKHGKLATVSAVRPPARFGSMMFKGNQVVKFTEKSQAGEGWINGGYFVLESKVLDFIESDDTIFERSPLEELAKKNQLMAYRHEGFWQCMDTLRDLQLLKNLWESNQAPWKKW